MTIITISCPSCGFTRQIPADKVPEGRRQATCPQCKNVFVFAKPAPELSPLADAASAPPSPPPPTEPAQDAIRNHSDPLPASPPVRPKPTPKKMLRDIGVLFSDSWQLYQRRFAVLIGLYLLTLAAFSIPAGIFIGVAILAGMAKGGGTLVAIGAIGLLVGLCLGFRSLASFLHAVVDDQLGFRDALQKGKGLALPLFWVWFLSAFIIGGGTALLVIPGIIFMVWFFFAQFILVEEDTRGMSALLKSREYVKGEWFKVALRLLLVWLVSLLISLIPFAGPFLCLAFFPFVMIFHYLVYQDLREMKGDIVFSCGTVDLLRWPAVALLGFIVVPLALGTFLGFTFFSKLPGGPLPGTDIVLKGTPSDAADTDQQDVRVFSFPQGDSSALPENGAGSASDASSPTGDQNPFANQQGYPDNIHLFIYAVNYTGTISANGRTIKELEGTPDMQYNYNTNGEGLRYGENLLEINYAEIPNPPSSMLEVHVKISRSASGKGKEILGEWRFNDRGTGKKTFTFDIPKE